jgi:(1->4)-alpha-D-glucan 1-alpha-D-glucosylmutase
MVCGMVSGDMKRASHIPLATYRLQLNRDFTFAQATEIVPYLSALGISHCYISPCLKARPGSMHGYDIVDHSSLNPEIGSRDDFDRFVNTLHDHGMGLILDIVPNHMAVMGSDNAWWLDVLENGEASVYSCFFDIDWRPLKEELHGKVLVPILHDHYGAVLESGELKVVFRAERGEFDIAYRDHRFPVNPREYPRILQRAEGPIAAKMGDRNQDLLEFQNLIAGFSHLPARQEASGDLIIERNRDKEINKRRLAELCARSPDIVEGIAAAIASLNGTPADPSSFNDLHELIKGQAFRLANWRVASDDINYRRFFDTNDLAGICMENESVFQATHRLVLELVAEGKVDGLRIDHPDGLYDPAQYFERLKQSIATALGDSENAANGSLCLFIEKIVLGPEQLPAEWPVCGTTGYDFANLVNGLFVDSAAAVRLEGIYKRFIDDEVEFDDLAYSSRRLIVRVALASELSVLANRLARIALSKRKTCDFTLNNLRDALMEVVASFPVYRTYVTPSGISENDARYIRQAIALAKQRSPAADTSVFDFVENVLLTSIAEGQDPAYRNAVTTFAMKFQQFTSPVMAKGLEDTAFYRHNRLVSLNEVGSDPDRFGTTVREFHAANRQRLRDWPHTMLAGSTHDSKRAEDARARINVLSEISPMWGLKVREWRRLNRVHKSAVNAAAAPSPNDEYLLYQTLVGAWPAEPVTDQKDQKAFRARIENYMLKAIREAKQNTSWINQNTIYEGAVTSFVRALLNPGEDNRFLKDFVPFQRRIARIGLWNSLSQTVLRLTSPGLPDIYQGNELWDFSLVDPDNRRPVDYDRRRQIFEELKKWGNAPDAVSIDALLNTPEDDRIKSYLIWRTLCFRQQQPDIFQKGEYLPLSVKGAKSEHLVAFARKHGDSIAVVAAPRLISGLLNDANRAPTGTQIWEDTRIHLPRQPVRQNFRNIFTGETAESEAEIPVSKVLSEFPVAIWLKD